ncbi:MAG: tRNA pseudouridine(55) synthase TruB [bacterium]
MNEEMNNKIFGVYKPKGPSSYWAVSQIKKMSGIKKVGHAGTLDPLASGVLVIAVGREATKKIAESVQKEKEYIAEIELGATSETDDGEGPIIKTPKHKNIKTKKAMGRPSMQDIQMILKNFVGEIDQVPPIYSAIKIAGQRAYKVARQGQKPEMKSRKVLIKEIEILDYVWPILKIKVVTGPGVYIRSLARDIGDALGCGAYMKELERTRVGEFTKEDCILL